MTTLRPFWLDQALKAQPAEPCLPLRQETRADVCIVGGGYTGLWTAIMLKEQNPQLDVVIVEADICGAGASGRNGGCALSWSAKYFTLERLFGRDEAVRLVQASEASIYAIGDFCKRYGVDAEYRLDGTLYTATNRAQLGSTDAVIAALERNGINSFVRCPRPELRVGRDSCISRQNDPKAMIQKGISDQDRILRRHAARIRIRSPSASASPITGQERY